MMLHFFVYYLHVCNTGLLKEGYQYLQIYEWLLHTKWMKWHNTCMIYLLSHVGYMNKVKYKYHTNKT